METVAMNTILFRRLPHDAAQLAGGIVSLLHDLAAVRHGEWK
jgi:hypothetical protein